MLIEKAQESLRAAELCYNEKLYNSVANRAYYAMFQAAVVALGLVGIHPKGDQWSHENLQAVFNRELIHQRKLLPRRMARCLPDAVDLRHKADYRRQHISAKEATDVLNQARDFFQQIERQIGDGA